MSQGMIEAIGAVGLADVTPERAATARPATSFAHLLLVGVDQVEQKQATADAAVQAFALDDSIPVHQVTWALEEARLSVELMMQVRTRLLEGYQELLRMQL